MAAIKKSIRKNVAVNTKTIEVKIVNNEILKTKEFVPVKGLNGAKQGTAKVYPPIYTYIYERESEDMAKLLQEYKNVKITQKKTIKISGFKIVDNKLLAIKK